MKNLFKKTMITMCSAVMLMGIGAVSANAATTTVGDFTVDAQNPATPRRMW